MPRKIYIGSAWPYVNGPLHLGHIAGLVSADFLARYHRLCGDEVLWTSGSDCHGTPITERARKENRSPREVAEEFHAVVARTFDRFGFSYSLYWATKEPAHYARVQESFLELYQQGLIVEDDYLMARCETCQETRSDREINGTCPHCHDTGARGDQCDACGEVVNPSELKNPTCSKCAGSISFEKSRELFFDLPALEERLTRWFEKQTHWRENAKAWTKGWLEEGLKRRPITRKIDWGIPVPLAGWEHRRIYVWFEAVHGYWTASQEWAKQTGNPEAWKAFWQKDDPNVLAYYVIGKDNIPFHTLMWPGILIALGLALPHHIVSSEYLIFEDRKLSTSKGWVLWADDISERYDPDIIRYFLAANGPEKQDTNFTWERFVRIVNGELVNNYSNLVNRTLSFAKKNFDGKVPALSNTDDQDSEILSLVHRTFDEVRTLIEQTEFRRAVEKIMELVQFANKYLSDRAPWTQIRSDRVRAGTTINVVIQVIAALAILTEPFMPFQSKRLREMLSLADKEVKWQAPELAAGTPIGELEHLFSRLDEGIIATEQARLEKQLKDSK